MPEEKNEQQRKLQAIEIGTSLQKLDGIGLIVVAAVHDGDELDRTVLTQFRVTISRLSHLVEAAFREQEQQVEVEGPPEDKFTE
jgi:hypothetical protein